MMSFTTCLEGPAQRIAFLHSKDLINWEKRWPEPRIEAKPPYYETDGTKSISNPPAFRDAFVHRVGDHYEALIGAHATSGPALLRGSIARYKSVDPELRNWEPMPPILGPGISSLMEVPEHFYMGDRHYLIWSNVFWLGAPTDTLSRQQCSGTFYAMSDSYDGPYVVPEDNLLIGCSLSSQSYVGRTISWNGERLLYHHMWKPHSSLGFPKRIVQKSDGTIKTAYWPGIEKVHTGEIQLPLDLIKAQGEYLHAGEWNVVEDSGLVGSVDGGGSLGLVPVDLEDVHLRCRVTVESGTRFGITLRDLGQPSKRKEGVSKEIHGVAIQGDLRQGQWQFGAPAHAWASRIDMTEMIMEAPQIGKTYRMDLIVRDVYFEVYIDEIWKFTRIVNDRARSGGIGFYVDGGTARFEKIQAWNLEPMSHPYPDPWPAVK